jgi:hypothetical protein
MMTYSLIFLCIVLSCGIGLLVWYIRQLLMSIDNLHELTKSLLSTVADYGEHLDKVYNMETFYGDSTLGALLEHTNELKTELLDAVNSGNQFFGTEEISKEEQDG